MLLTLRYMLQSETGLRVNNEDAALAGPRLLALADGVGGNAGGEVAASIAIENLVRLNERPPDRDLLRALRDAVLGANEAIAERAAADTEIVGMGTTLTALLFAGDHLGLVHVGDSRAYLLRGGELTQITKDDSLVQWLVDHDRLTPEEAMHHPQRSMVTKVLTGEPVDPHLEIREVEAEDRYLICSDGLSDYVPSEAIAVALQFPDARRCPQELIHLALRHGSQDNITCIVGEVVEGRSGYDIALTSGAIGRSATLVSA